MNTRLPLSPYCNPLPALLRQPRCFPLQKPLILSLFCKDDFQEQNHRCMATTTGGTFPFPNILTQGRLRCTQHTILCTALQVHTRLVREEGFQTWSSQTSSHNTRSPRKPGRMLHAIGARPGSLTPSIHPKLGVKSRHQGLHRCALHRIFRPYLGTGHFD